MCAVMPVRAHQKEPGLNASNGGYGVQLQRRVGIKQAQHVFVVRHARKQEGQAEDQQQSTGEIAIPAVDSAHPMIVTQRAARCSANTSIATAHAVNSSRTRPANEADGSTAPRRLSAAARCRYRSTLPAAGSRRQCAVPPGAAAGACTLSCVGIVSASERYTAVRRIRSVRALMSARSGLLLEVGERARDALPSARRTARGPP